MEPNQVRVLSVDVLEALAAAMVRCKEDLAAALLEGDSELDRIQVWLERDRILHWKKRVQRLELEVQAARSALFRKENYRVTHDSKPSTRDERKALMLAQAMLEDAERRLKASQRWNAELPRLEAGYRRGVNPLAAMLDRDLPASIAALRRMSIALERYVQEQPTDLRSLLPERPETGPVESTRRVDGDDHEGSRLS